MKRIYSFIILALMGSPLLAQTAQPLPTFSHDVAQIIFTHCTTCHRPGSIAPFSLQTYQDAYNYRFSILAEVPAGIMPPWPANISYQRFAHERVLSCDEINTIVTWVNNGAPEGDANLTPPIPQFPNGSTLGTPDLVLQIPTYTIPAGTNNDLYRCFVLPTGLTSTKYITAVEAIPGDRAIVHHALIYQDTTNAPVQLDAADPGPGYTNFGGTGSNKSVLINGWVPGSTPTFFPENMAIQLQPGANIVVQIHYPAGSAGKTDSTKINLFFADDTVGIRNVTLAPILNHGNSMTDGPLVIPANTTKTFHEHYKLPATVTVLAVAPHMHLIGKKIKSFAVTPAGDTIKLIDIENWDFHWQGGYSFRNPIRLPSGTNLYSEAFYDNTVHNSSNPNNPPQDVHVGESTTDEMMLIYFTFLYPYVQGDQNIVIDTTSLADPVCRITYVTGIDEPSTKASLQLFDAVPNPTNGNATISFNLPQAAAVDLTMYDITGRQTAKLMDHETLAAGMNSFIMDSQLPIGIYFIRLAVDGQLLTKKLVVTK